MKENKYTIKQLDGLRFTVRHVTRNYRSRLLEVDNISDVIDKKISTNS